jgi:hypothetical protein
MGTIVKARSAEIEEIQQQMRNVRADLRLEVGEVVDSARALTDWRVHWRQHPGACLALAAAAGFFIIPGRPATAELAGARQSVPAGTLGVRKERGFLAHLAGIALGLVVQQGAAVASQKLEKLLERNLHSAPRPNPEKK